VLLVEADLDVVEVEAEVRETSVVWTEPDAVLQTDWDKWMYLVTVDTGTPFSST
jgi:hypothetical protein